MGLTPQQLDFYRREGYLVVHDVLDAAELERLRAAMVTLVEGAGCGA
jgi:ectoine hydroxylase-related dioxygenase (phytanoyl-CoA dioxygenase family)